MQDPRERALHYVRTYGPVLPVQIAKELHTDILMAGAILSELAANKGVKITTVKRGGSPFYYVPSQEPKLQSLMEYLQEKEQEAYKFLNKERVIRDKNAGPVMRVALRAIKDYAVPIAVTSENGEELFWKWYLANEQEVRAKVNAFLMNGIPENEEKKELVKEERKTVVEGQKEREPQKIQKKKPLQEKKEFDTTLKEYYTEHEFVILKEEKIKKNKEYSYIVNIPSQIGKLDFYVKVKNKRTITPTDLSLAYSEGQLRNLPVIFISNGVLTKKAQEYLAKELKGQVFFRTI